MAYGDIILGSNNKICVVDTDGKVILLPKMYLIKFVVDGKTYTVKKYSSYLQRQSLAIAGAEARSYSGFRTDQRPDNGVVEGGPFSVSEGGDEVELRNTEIVGFTSAQIDPDVANVNTYQSWEFVNPNYTFGSRTWLSTFSVNTTHSASVEKVGLESCEMKSVDKGIVSKGIVTGAGEARVSFSTGALTDTTSSFSYSVNYTCNSENLTDYWGREWLRTVKSDSSFTENSKIANGSDYGNGFGSFDLILDIVERDGKLVIDETRFGPAVLRMLMARYKLADDYGTKVYGDAIWDMKDAICEVYDKNFPEVILEEI